ncbi:MAG: 2-hydroxyacyl-CoA dehydratase subunit D [Candidatus Bathyarchaeaceae archaeon]
MSQRAKRSLSAAKEITSLVAAHYMSAIQAHSEGRRVAWCTAVAPPSEILYAMGIQPLFPENYACVVTVMRAARNMFDLSEAYGLSRDLCSYSRCVMGSILGSEAPFGGMEKPDILLSTKNVCVVYMKWWELMAHTLNCPIYVIDCPAITEKIEDYHVKYVDNQLRSLVSELEKITGTSLDEEKLKEAVKLSDRAAELWRKVIEQRRAKPCPMGVTDSSAAMFPMVASAGTQEAVEYYERLLDEVSGRVKEGVGALEEEKFRLLLSGIPYWHHLRMFNYLEDKYGAVFVHELYTATWGIASLNHTKPFESLAYKMLLNPTNMPINWGEKWIAGLVKDFDVDGIVLLSSRSCKATSIGNLTIQKILREEYGIPSLVLEADHTDDRVYSEAEVIARLDAFMEMLGAR